MIDPWSALLAASAAATIGGGVVKIWKEISDWVKQNKQNAQYSDKPNLKNYPRGTTYSNQGNGVYMIYEPGKQPYQFQPKASPIVFSDDTIKQIDNMTPQGRALVNNLVGKIQQDPGGFLGAFNNKDNAALIDEAAQGQLPSSLSSLQQSGQFGLPSAEQLGFPQSQNNIPQLMQDTDFGPIEQQARQQFNQQTIPGLAERFAGLGGLNSTAFTGELGKAGAGLEGQLAALRSQYGLQRANVLGSLGQKQQALDTGRAQAAGALGLGLQNNQLGQQQLRGSLLSSLLGNSQYANANNPQRPGMADYALGAGLTGLGLAGQNYFQQNLLQQLKDLR